jgi:hypothetical protein
MPDPGPDDAHPVATILAGLSALSLQDNVTVRDVIAHFGPASFVPALLVPALIVVSPLSGIFFLPTVMGLTMALIAAQMLVGRRTLWLPGIILARQITGARLAATVRRLGRLSARIDRMTRPRLTILTRWPGTIVAQLGTFFCGLMMPFLELVPLSSSILGLAITFFAVSFLSRDGLFVAIGLALMGIAALIPSFMVYRFA